MEQRYLNQEEKQSSRELYEDCFPEDSEQFVDYYYQEKCKDNDILAVLDAEHIVSMIQLNPYTISQYGQLAKVHYIVAVATDEAYRRQGWMRKLMEQVFRDLCQKKEPFTFLMPANPDYYYSCGFEYWENQIEWKQNMDCEWTNRKVCALLEESCDALAAFSNEVLEESFDLFVHRDGGYYRRLLKEQKSEDGNIAVIWKVDPQTKALEEICGSFCYGRDIGLEVREPIMRENCSQYIHPLLMGRVLNLEQFCGMIKTTSEQYYEIEIRDTMISENNGYFAMKFGKDGGTIRRIYDHKPELSMDIAEFGQKAFSKMRIFINELV